MNNLPNARTSNIILQELKGELLIYDLRINKAFCLNQTSAIVYQACNGKTTFAELKRKHKFDDDLIYFALDELKKEGLLENSSSYSSPFESINRREVIKKVGLASMAVLPLIVGITAPTAAMAASTNNSCVPVGGCRAAGSIICPVGCMTTINVIGYQTNDGTCGGLTTPEAVNCSNFQGFSAGVDFQRLS